MKAIDYIKNNQLNLNRRVLNEVLAKERVELTDELWSYLTDTPENTNWRLLNSEFGISLDGTSRKKADNEFDNLGTLLYYGSAGYDTDEPVNIPVEEMDPELVEINMSWNGANCLDQLINGLIGVFDGMIVLAEPTSENSLIFPSYLSLEILADTEGPYVQIQKLGDNLPSNYAIYGLHGSPYLIEERTYARGELCYYGNLQNGNLFIDGVPQDEGLIEKDSNNWARYFGIGDPAYLVSNNIVTVGEEIYAGKIDFNGCQIEVLDLESSSPTITVSNAPSEECAIYLYTAYRQQEPEGS